VGPAGAARRAGEVVGEGKRKCRIARVGRMAGQILSRPGPSAAACENLPNWLISNRIDQHQIFSANCSYHFSRIATLRLCRRNKRHQRVLAMGPGIARPARPYRHVGISSLSDEERSCHPERTGPQTFFSLGVVSRRICSCFSSAIPVYRALPRVLARPKCRSPYQPRASANSFRLHLAVRNSRRMWCLQLKALRKPLKTLRLFTDTPSPRGGGYGASCLAGHALAGRPHRRVTGIARRAQICVICAFF
jgi:hypothetical protein